MSQPDNSGSFDARKLRGGNLVLPASILAALLGAAAAFGAANWRLTNLENGRTEDHQDRVRMEDHIENDDKGLPLADAARQSASAQFQGLDADPASVQKSIPPDRFVPV